MSTLDHPALRYYNHRSDTSSPKGVNRTWRTLASHTTGPYTVMVGETYRKGHQYRKGQRSYGVMVTVDGKPGVFFGVAWPTERSARDAANKIFKDLRSA